MCRWRSGRDALAAGKRNLDLMIRVSSYTEVGGHAKNEDAFAVRPHPADPNSYLGVVADGQGGRTGGAVASQVASEVFLKVASGYSPRKLAFPVTWAAILRAVDEAVRDDPEAGFTTLVALCVAGGFIAGASCGDSAAVLFNADRPGVALTAGQDKNPPVGSGGAALVPFTARLVAPWTLLVMSDSVWKYAGWENVLASTPTASGEDIINRLLEHARLPGNGGLQDDFTLIVLQQNAC